MDLHKSTQEMSMSNNYLIDNQISFEIGDFSFETDGSINVIFTNFDLNCPIYIYKVNLKLSVDSSMIDGKTELIATINIQNEQMAVKTKLLFTSNESAQNFCVALKSTQHGTSNDIIQIWQPSQLNQNLIGSFDLNISNNDQCNLLKSIKCPSALTSLVIPKSTIAFKDLNDNKNLIEPFYLMTAYNNGTIGLIDTQNYNQFFTSAIPSYNSNNFISSQNKKLESTQEYILSIDQSYMGLIGVGITNLSRLVTIRPILLMKDINSCGQSHISHLFNLYEYCIITGYDYWDLLVSTHTNLFGSLIERIEEKCSNSTLSSFQRVHFSQYNALLYSMYRRSLDSQYRAKSLDLLSKLNLNRSMSIISFSVQFVLNIDSLAINLSNNLTTSNLTSLINKSNQPPTVNSLLINQNLDLINQHPINSQPQTILSQIKFKSNLNEYFNDLLKSKNEMNLAKLNLNEIIQSVLSRKNYQILVNQQLKHVFQWILDFSLNLINILLLTKQKQNSADGQYSATGYLLLLNDLWTLNEIRKALIYMKLLFVYSSLVIQPQVQQQSHNSSNYFITSSLPVLPVKSSMQKDLLTELFNIFTKFVIKTTEGTNILNDETIIEQCAIIQSEVIITPINDYYFNLKHSWFGGKISNNLNKTLQFPVDILFEEEKSKKQYPLFDIIRLIKFSRSSITKRCIRCGNYTESNTHQNVQSSKVNCIYIQDACGEKCICGGLWVLSSIQ